jgi:putative ATP-binding cassette transporter
MQEASDAFAARGEGLVLDMLRHELPDTTLVTISFHPGLEALHHRTLVVRREGSPLTGSAAAASPARRSP